MSCSHLASPLRSSGSLFPVTWHHPCGPVDHYSQSPGITPVVQWISIPREDSLQIQARSTLIPHKSAVPLYPLHLQVRIQVLRHCWQPSHLASPLRSSGSLILVCKDKPLNMTLSPLMSCSHLASPLHPSGSQNSVIWHDPCSAGDHSSQVSEKFVSNGFSYL
eukprot:XP_017445635.1 PREDICTED: uncharacterized protein LOC102548730 isoform X1 [Rattus norvegicus]